MQQRQFTISLTCSALTSLIFQTSNATDVDREKVKKPKRRIRLSKQTTSILSCVSGFTVAMMVVLAVPRKRKFVHKQTQTSSTGMDQNDSFCKGFRADRRFTGFIPKVTKNLCTQHPDCFNIGTETDKVLITNTDSQTCQYSSDKEVQANGDNFHQDWHSHLELDMVETDSLNHSQQETTVTCIFIEEKPSVTEDPEIAYPLHEPLHFCSLSENKKREFHDRDTQTCSFSERVSIETQTDCPEVTDKGTQFPDEQTLVEEDVYSIPSKGIATPSLKESDVDASSISSTLVSTPDPTQYSITEETDAISVQSRRDITSNDVGPDTRNQRRFSFPEPPQPVVTNQTIPDSKGEPRECLLAPIGSYQTNNIAIQDSNYVYSKLHRNAWR